MISHDYYSIINCMDYVLIIEYKTIRKISMRKFRKMIYASHFDKDYLLNYLVDVEGQDAHEVAKAFLVKIVLSK